MRHALLVLAALSLATTADAGVIYVKKGAPGANNGTSWNDAFAELRDALPTAQPGDQVWVAAGTYTPVPPGGNVGTPLVVGAGVAVYGGFSGSEFNLLARDWRVNRCIVSGDIAGDDNGSWPVGSNSRMPIRLFLNNSRLDGLVITGTSSSGLAAVYCDSLAGPAQSGEIVNCVFEWNDVPCVSNPLPSTGGSVALTQCVFVDNRSSFGVLDRFIGLNGPIVASNCTFVRNSRTGGEPTLSSGGVAFANCISWANQLPVVYTNFAPGDFDTIHYSNLEVLVPGPGNISTTPWFEDVALNDFRLRRSSPCIDAGSNALVPTIAIYDYFGLSRFVDYPATPDSGFGTAPVVDMGAIEFASPDCDGNGISDWNEIAQGLLRDLNADLISDACQPLGMPFCFGDGSGTACPCANVGAPATGCSNSEGGSGRLRAIGRASVADDTVVLVADGLGQTATALYFQGTGLDLFAGTSGIPFGDGLRCVFGTIVRLPIRNSINGQSAVGPGVPGDPRISVMGAPVTPGTRYYQAWYRDSFPFCTPAFYNMTNAVQITWGP